MSSEDRKIEFVSAKEEAGVSRNLIIWLTSWLDSAEDAPASIELIDYEFIPPETVCMAMSLVQSAYIVEQFIDGSYTAEYQFKIIYRGKPSSPDARLKMDELLDTLGAWASEQKPFIGDGLEVQEIEQTTVSALYARLENGWEDHQIFFRMTYKVHPER